MEGRRDLVARTDHGVSKASRIQIADEVATGTHQQGKRRCAWRSWNFFRLVVTAVNFPTPPALFLFFLTKMSLRLVTLVDTMHLARMWLKVPSLVLMWAMLNYCGHLLSCLLDMNFLSSSFSHLSFCPSMASIN